MRTTVTLDPDVDRMLKEEMRRSGTSFRETLNRAVRRGLADSGCGSTIGRVKRPRSQRNQNLLKVWSSPGRSQHTALVLDSHVHLLVVRKAETFA